MIWIIIWLIIWLMMSLLLCCITVGSRVHVYKHFTAHCWVSGPVGCPGIDVCSNTIAYILIIGSCGVLDSAPNRRTTVCQYGQFSLCTKAKLWILRGFRRWGAIKALRPGAYALTSVLFFDSINRDKKGTYCFEQWFE